MKYDTKLVETYAFGDPESNISFCIKELMQHLGTNGRNVKLTLDTMGSQHHMYSYTDFETHDIKLKQSAELPVAYSKDTLPVSRAHIPTQHDI